MSSNEFQLFRTTRERGTRWRNAMAPTLSARRWRCRAIRQLDHKGPQRNGWGVDLESIEITGVLGVGGMGVVLKAHDTSIERDVAIKVLPTELSTDEVALGRFLAEAKSAGKLSHANTVTIYEIAQEGPTHYLAMEVVSGGSAEDHLERSGAYSVSDATRMIIEACNGLSAAHEAGLIHRDIKPSNLLLTQGGTVKVSDFGLAKRTQSQTLQMTKSRADYRHSVLHESGAMRIAGGRRAERCLLLGCYLLRLADWQESLFGQWQRRTGHVRALQRRTTGPPRDPIRRSRRLRPHY